MFNTDSGFRPPSPLTFAPPSHHSLFGEMGFNDFNLPGQDFLNLPTSPPPPPLPSDPSMQLFNPLEQRYFSEFLDTLVVDQDYTFDPSLIPNLPNMSLFTSDTTPNGFSLDGSSSLMGPPGTSTSMSSSSSTGMDFDLASPSSQQSSFSGSHSFPNSHFSQNGSPVLPGSPLPYTTSDGLPNASKRGKTNKGTEARRGHHSSSSSFSQDSSKISTPIQQQLSKLSLNNSNNNNNNNNNNEPSNPKKNKREEDEHPTPLPSPRAISSPSRSQIKKEDSQERLASISDGSMSDTTTVVTSPVSATTPTGTTKRKPYKELLTEDEKRANHIASEQKRRNTIRNGFKDMTDIVPDLRDVNSSKSTILFKAVDFIRHLERQNQVLQAKANRLESRLMNQRNDDQRLQDIPHIYPVPSR
ncbi:hypothetical protein BGZ65_012066 [Modicella reniformis]|uniref:BHLH domain-containing protein n=1 Tax=Modicella reniformis TaxID=1440133 RepID=A0A9P6MKK6_9FUNG|nr:hypothetical protein BGZ65_012066 [Modicella reniformis]